MIEAILTGFLLFVILILGLAFIGLLRGGHRGRAQIFVNPNPNREGPFKCPFDEVPVEYPEDKV